VYYGFPTIKFCNPGVHYETPCINHVNVGDIKIVTWDPTGKNTADVVKVTRIYFIVAVSFVKSPDDELVN
jgi:hypothetical protein